MSVEGSSPTAAHHAARQRLNDLLKTREGLDTLGFTQAHTLPLAMRTALDPPPGMSPSAETAIIEGTTQALEVIYGKALANCIKMEVEDRDLRQYIERPVASAQCRAVIGSIISEQRIEGTPPNASVCWICDKKIGAWYLGEGETNSRPECEHKFSVAQSIFFTGLYDPTVKKVLPPNKREQYTALLKKEYGWAHQRCNQVKKDISLVTFEKRGGVLTWIPNTDKIKNLLREIINEAYLPGTWIPSPSAMRRKIGETHPNVDAWLVTREQDIVRQVQTILNVANGIPTRTLLATAVVSLHKRAEVLHPHCWNAYPIAPDLASTRVRRVEPKVGGVVMDKYDDANMVLEFVVKRESAKKFFAGFDSDIPIDPTLPERELTPEEGESLGKALYGDEYIVAVKNKIEDDNRFFDSLASSKLYELYAKVDAEGVNVPELDEWIMTNIVYSSSSLPGSPLPTRGTAPGVIGSPDNSQGSVRTGSVGNSQVPTPASSQVPSSADVSEAEGTAKAKSTVIRDRSRSRERIQGVTRSGRPYGGKKTKKSKKKHRRTRRRIRLL